MARQLTCGQGHTWEAADGATDLGACPVCAAPPGATPRTLPFLIPTVREPGGPGAGEASSMAADASGAALPPPSLPGYEVLGLLGRGGMGVVYKARQVSLGRVVALKMLLSGPHADPALLARFRIEAETLARLAHPHVVQIHEVGQVDGQPYLVLEYVAGGTLADKLKGTPQPPRVAAAWLVPLARAVHFAHSQGVLHRDLKPGNVLVAADGALKVTDFGLAKLLPGAGAANPAGPTTGGQIMGTPSYMAPEQASGVTQVPTPAADVYALGAILYEMLTGRPPFLAASPFETVLQVLQEEPVPPRRLQRAVPRDLETICLKCLHKSPARRYPSAAELAEDVERYLAGRPIRARPAGAAERALKWAKRRPTQAALLAVSLLALALGGAGAAAHQYRLNKANDDLREALGREQRLRGRNDDLIRLSMDQFSKLGWEMDGAVKHDPALRKLLAKARLPYYEVFLKQAPRDREARHRYAFALMEVGNVHDLVGDAAEAVRCFDRSEEVWAGLIAEFPEDPDYRRRAARLQGRRGLFYLAQTPMKEEEARQCFRGVLGRFDPLRERGLLTAADERERYLAHYYLRLLAEKRWRWGEAEAHARESLRLAERGLALAPKDPRALHDLGAALGTVADLERTLSQGGLLRPPAGPPDAAAAVWTTLAHAHLSFARSRTAIELFGRALERHRQGGRLKAPTYSDWETHRWHGFELARLAYRLGDAAGLAEAAAALEEAADALTATDPPGGTQHVGAALTLALSLPLLPPEARAEREKRAARCVALLRKACGRGQHDADAVRRLPAFEPLLGRPDFKALLAEMEKKGRP